MPAYTASRIETIHKRRVLLSSSSLDLLKTKRHTSGNGRTDTSGRSKFRAMHIRGSLLKHAWGVILKIASYYGFDLVS